MVTKKKIVTTRQPVLKSTDETQLGLTIPVPALDCGEGQSCRARRTPGPVALGSSGRSCLGLLG